MQPDRLYPPPKILVWLPGLQDKVQIPNSTAWHCGLFMMLVLSLLHYVLPPPRHPGHNLITLNALSTPGGFAALCLCTPLSPLGIPDPLCLPAALPFTSTASSVDPSLNAPRAMRTQISDICSWIKGSICYLQYRLLVTYLPSPLQ